MLNRVKSRDTNVTKLFNAREQFQLSDGGSLCEGKAGGGGGHDGVTGAYKVTGTSSSAGKGEGGCLFVVCLLLYLLNT